MSNQLTSGPRSLYFLGQYYPIPNNVAIPGEYGLWDESRQAEWLAVSAGHPEAMAAWGIWYASFSEGGGDPVGAVNQWLDEWHGNDQGTNEGGSFIERNLTYPVINAISPGVDAGAKVAQSAYELGGILNQTYQTIGIGTIALVGLGLLAVMLYTQSGGRRRR